MNLSVGAVSMNQVVPIAMPWQKGSYVGYFNIGSPNMPCSPYILTCADYTDTVDESDESNNCRTENGKCGDVKKDGYVTGWDVSVLNNAVGGMQQLDIELKWAGDVMTDGYLTGWDVSVLNNRVGGQCAVDCQCTQTSCPP